jgi:hypothetical protein
VTGFAVLGERMVRHGLVDRPARTVVDAVALTGALQAQDPVAGRLGVRSRARGLRDADVVRAQDVERTIVRTSLMRATIHLVTTEDVRWLTALFGPLIARSFAKRWQQLGLSEALLDRCATALAEILTDTPLTRAEVMIALAGRGIAIGAAGQAPTHVLLHATTHGLACRGPDRGREPTFVQLGRWVPGAPAGPRGDEALAEIARRYFAAYSPATAKDFTVWSGLPSGRAIGLIRDELSSVEVNGRPGYRLGAVEPMRGFRMLSAFDNYLVGYSHREGMVADDRRAEIYVGGMIRPTLLRDGRVIGRWQLRRKAGAISVDTIGFDPVTRSIAAAIERDTADIRDFVGGR